MLTSIHHSMARNNKSSAFLTVFNIIMLGEDCVQKVNLSVAKKYNSIFRLHILSSPKVLEAYFCKKNCRLFFCFFFNQGTINMLLTCKIYFCTLSHFRDLYLTWRRICAENSHPMIHAGCTNNNHRTPAWQNVSDDTHTSVMLECLCYFMSALIIYHRHYWAHVAPAGDRNTLVVNVAYCGKNVCATLVFVRTIQCFNTCLLFPRLSTVPADLWVHCNCSSCLTNCSKIFNL